MTYTEDKMILAIILLPLCFLSNTQTAKRLDQASEIISNQQI